jgi:hypothetical protein
MNSKIKLHEITKSPERTLKKGKIGKLIRATLLIIISENLITEIEIKKFIER